MSIKGRIFIIKDLCKSTPGSQVILLVDRFRSGMDAGKCGWTPLDFCILCIILSHMYSVLPHSRSPTA